MQQGDGKLRRTQQRECSGRAVTGRTGTAPLLPLCYLLTRRSLLLSTAAAAATGAHSRSVCGGGACRLPSSPRLELEGWTEARRSPTSLPLPSQFPSLASDSIATPLYYCSFRQAHWAFGPTRPMWVTPICSHFTKPIWFSQQKKKKFKPIGSSYRRSGPAERLLQGASRRPPPSVLTAQRTRRGCDGGERCGG